MKMATVRQHALSLVEVIEAPHHAYAAPVKALVQQAYEVQAGKR